MITVFMTACVSEPELNEGADTNGADPNSDNESEVGIDIDKNRDKLEEIAKEAFTIYYSYVDLDLFADNARKDLEAGHLNVDYPGISTEEYIEAVNIDIEEMTETESGNIQMLASVSYPHINEEQIESITAELEERILSEAESQDRAIDLQNIFNETLQAKELDQERTNKTLTLTAEGDNSAKNGTSKDDTDETNKDNTDINFKVVEMDRPDDLFQSFDKAFQRAIADGIQDVVIDLRPHGLFLGWEDTVKAKFQGEKIVMESDFLGKYLRDELKLILTEENEILLTEIWDQLSELAGYNPHLQFGPENYLNQVIVGKTTKDNVVSISFTRPYAVATKDSVIGYIDLEQDEINLFDKVSGPGQQVSDFFWSQGGDYLAYYYTESGSGFNYLNVYDIASDELIKINEIETFKENHGNGNQGLTGEFNKLRWLADEDILSFKVTSFQEKEDGKGNAYRYKLDVVTEELRKNN